MALLVTSETDVNGHVGKLVNGYECIHGDYGYGLRNTEREHTLEFTVAHDLVVGNSHVNKKKKKNLITYQMGRNSSQIHYILFKK